MPASSMRRRVRDVGLEPLEHLAQRDDFFLELLHALGQAGDVRRSRLFRRARIVGERDAHFGAMTPLHDGAQRLFLLRNVEIDDVRD